MAAHKPVSLVLSGLRGIGSRYLEELLSRPKKNLFKLAGVVDPGTGPSRHQEKLKELGVPYFSTLEEFYSTRKAELAVISSPIHLHSLQTCLALSQGSNVLCEKPAAAVIQDVLRMIRAAKDAGRFTAVGYQWSFSQAVQNLKADILAGVFGKPRRLRCLYLWPRDEVYYGSNSWAGRIRDEEGHWILDSPANNAMAHDLHLMLYLLGGALDRSARPARVTAELFRAYRIPNYDTVAGRILTQEGVEILVFFSHACAVDIGPVASYEFEKGTILTAGRDSSLKAVLRDGKVTEYGSPGDQPFKKLWDCLKAVRSGIPPPCGIEAAAGQTLSINGFQESGPIIDFPFRLQDWDGEAGSRWVFVRGLEEVFVRCYERGLLPSEMKVGWARPSKEISLSDYEAFPISKI